MSAKLKRKGFYSDPVLKPIRLNPESFSHCPDFGLFKGNTGWYRNDIKFTNKTLNNLYEGGYVIQGVEYNPDNPNDIKWPTYELNKFRFRSDDWTSGEEGIIFLGCSDIFGVGNYYEKTASYIVSNELGVKNYNLGVPGGGLDQAYKYLKYHISDIKGKYVILAIPEVFRRELFADWKPLMIQAPSFTNSILEHQLSNLIQVDKVKELYFKLLANSHYVTCQTSKNLDAIKYLCQENNKTLLSFKNPVYCRIGYERNLYLQEMKLNKKLTGVIAADQKHYGWPYQKFLADQMLRLIEK